MQFIPIPNPITNPYPIPNPICWCRQCWNRNCYNSNCWNRNCLPCRWMLVLIMLSLCRQLNDELTAKTESLVQEADEVLVSVNANIFIHSSIHLHIQQTQIQKKLKEKMYMQCIKLSDVKHDYRLIKQCYVVQYNIVVCARSKLKACFAFMQQHTGTRNSHSAAMTDWAL